MSTNDFAHVWGQVSHDLGWDEANMQRDRPYNGQEHTDKGKRGQTMVQGLTMRDIKDCFMRAYILSHSYYAPGTADKIQPNATLIDEAHKGVGAALSENDLYTLKGDIDPNSVSQNLTCEIERVMGIYPNVPRLHYESDKEG